MFNSINLFFIMRNSGRQVATREVGLVGSHGNNKLQPFMVAFFRASVPNGPSRVGQFLRPPTSNEESLEDEEDDEPSRKPRRSRRQATSGNRKRSKDSEEFGTWNPYTGLIIL